MIYQGRHDARRVTAAACFHRSCHCLSGRRDVTRCRRLAVRRITRWCARRASNHHRPTLMHPWEAATWPEPTVIAVSAADQPFCRVRGPPTHRPTLLVVYMA
ncbi:uncharacterized protein LOC144136660 [Amblyomma americanum]